MQNENEVTCLVVGSKQVGKTSLIEKFASEIKEIPQSQTTYHSDWHHQGQVYRITFKEILLTSNILQEHAIKSADVYAFVYDVTSRESFDQVISQLKVMIKHDIFKDSAKILLVGNKADKPGRLVGEEQGQAFGTDIGSFLETSGLQEIDTEQIKKAVLDIKEYSTFKEAMKTQQQERTFYQDAAPRQIYKKEKKKIEFSLAAPLQVELIDKCTTFSEILKVLVVGASRVGKSQFCGRIAAEGFNELYSPTIGVQFKIIYAKLGQLELKIQLWQASGSQIYACFTKSYYSGARIFVVIYDISDRSSFQKVNDYRSKIQHYGSKDSQILLVGNKTDLDAQRAVTQEEGAQLATEIYADYFQVSCKEGQGVRESLLKGIQHYLYSHLQQLKQP